MGGVVGAPRGWILRCQTFLKVQRTRRRIRTDEAQDSSAWNTRRRIRPHLLGTAEERERRDRNCRSFLDPHRVSLQVYRRALWRTISSPPSDWRQWCMGFHSSSMNFLKFFCVLEGCGVQCSVIDLLHLGWWGSVEYCIVVRLFPVATFPSSRHFFHHWYQYSDWINVGGAYLTYSRGVSDHLGRGECHGPLSTGRGVSYFLLIGECHTVYWQGSVMPSIRKGVPYSWHSPRATLVWNSPRATNSLALVWSSGRAATSG